MAPLQLKTLFCECGSFPFFLARVTPVLFRNERGLTVTCCQVIQLCRQTDVHRGAVERQLLCWHSPSYSADSGAWEFVQVVTVEQLILSVWHAVGCFVWVVLGGGRRTWPIDNSGKKHKTCTFWQIRATAQTRIQTNVLLFKGNTLCSCKF